MTNTTSNLLADFLSDLEQTAILWQVAVLTCSLLLAWGINHLLLGRIPKTKGVSKIGYGGLSRVAFPLLTLILVLIGRAVLKHQYSINLLNIVVPLLSAMMLIRIFVYALRQVFVSSSWLQSSERFIAMSIWLMFALYLSGLLPDMLDAMNYFSFNIGKQRISLLIILSGILSILVTMLAAMWLGRMLEHKVMATDHLDMNLRVVMAKLIRAFLIILGILVALPLAGIDITILSVFGGALGIGIGFGLQKIASNYVSGFIILLDRSIHPGDVLTVDGRFGVVSQLTTRYMVLLSNDGTEAIIPNETLVSSTVINHSFSNRKIRIAIPVQISYQSDLQRAMEIMKLAATSHARVLAEPKTKVFLKSFGDNGIDLEMGVWIIDPEEGQLNLRSDINLEIWRQFKEAGIEIPYPQRDVRIVSGQPSLGTQPS
jgi:small-conductance mechanosensitive channel